MRMFQLVIVGAFLGGMVTRGAAGTDPLLELKTPEKTYRGRVMALGQNVCWLMGRDTRLHRVQLREIDKQRIVAPRFRYYSAVEMRDLLRKEFGRDFVVTGTAHYLVCAPHQQADKYSPLFEKVFRAFHGYFSRRGFRIAEPEHPLVAIVFPDRRSFARYCRQDGLRPRPNLLGYYHILSNRIALYDPTQQLTSMNSSSRGTSDDGRESKPYSHSALHRRTGPRGLSVKEIIVHEGVHQAAFNTSLHSRIGASPAWLVEGLATLFEPLELGGAVRAASAQGRVNGQRLDRYREFAERRRPDNALTQLIGTDRRFRTATLDAYSQAWALSYYLVETRPKQYARYLQTVAHRDPFQPYPQRKRIDDFETVFGLEVENMEHSFLRFMDGLED